MLFLIDPNWLQLCNHYSREAGVGFSVSPPHNLQFDINRVAILKLLLTCFSESMYLPPTRKFHNFSYQLFHLMVPCGILHMVSGISFSDWTWCVEVASMTE